MLKRKEGEESDGDASNQRGHRRTHSHHHSKHGSDSKAETKAGAGVKDDKEKGDSAKPRGPLFPTTSATRTQQISAKTSEPIRIGEFGIKALGDGMPASMPDTPKSSRRKKKRIASVSGTPGVGATWSDSDSNDTILRLTLGGRFKPPGDDTSTESIKEAPITDIDVYSILGCARSDESSPSNVSNLVLSSTNNSDVDYSAGSTTAKKPKKGKEKKKKKKEGTSECEDALSDDPEAGRPGNAKRKSKKGRRACASASKSRSASVGKAGKPKKKGESSLGKCKLPHPRVICGKWRAEQHIGGHTFSGTPEPGGAAGKALAIKEHTIWEIGFTFITHIAARFTALTRVPPHPCVALSYDLCRRGDHTLYTVSSLAPGVSLAEALAARGAFSEAAVAACIAQVIAGLQHLHSAGFLHGNLHGGNVVLDAASGACCVVDIPLYAVIEDPAADPTIRGTPEYFAPEVVAKAPGRVPQSDVWALGCLSAELLAGETARGRRHPVAVLADALAGVPQQRVPAGASAECREFLEGCFEPSFERRASLAALRRLPFFTRFVPEDATPRECAEVLAKELAKAPGGGPDARSPLRNESGGRKFSSVAVCVHGVSEEDATQCVGKESTAELRIAAAAVPFAELRRRGFRNLSNEMARCCNAQDDLLRATAGLHDYTLRALDHAAACRARTNKVSVDLARARADRDHAVEKLNVMRENVLFFENAIVMNSAKGGGSKGEGSGITTLAMLAYGKLTVKNVKTAHSGNVVSGTLDTRCNAEPKWKSRYVVVRDNFVFVYKNDADSATPKKVIRLRDKPSAKRIGDIDGKSFCFALEGTDYTFSAQFANEADEWVAKVNEGLRWTEVPRHPSPQSQLPPSSPPPSSSSSSTTTTTSGTETTTPPGKSKVKVFGISAGELSGRDPADVSNPWLPAFLDVIVREIIGRGLSMEGILRVPGSTAEIKSLRERFETTYRAADVDISKADVRSLAGLMKIWIKELVVLADKRGSDVIEGFMTSCPRLNGKEEAREFLKVISPYCSMSSLAVFMKLGELIISISKNEKVNKMGVKNIFTCLGPSFGSNLDLELLSYFSMNYDVFEGFFSEYRKIITPHK